MNKLIQCVTVAILAAMTGTAIATTQPAPSSLGSAIVNNAIEANKRAAAAQQQILSNATKVQDAYVSANVPCINSILAQIPAAQKSCQNVNQQCIGPGNPSYSPQQCTQACQNALNTINGGNQLKVNGQPNGGGSFNSSIGNPLDNNIDECNFCSILMNQDSHGVSMPAGCSITPYGTSK
jgi:hypothetical protein